MPSDTDWAYAAGLVDGEGCITIAKQRQGIKKDFYYRPSVRISQNEHGLNMLVWLKNTFGGYVCICNKQSPKYKIPTYNWLMRDGGTEAFLMGVYPYLLLKKPQADIALELQKHRNAKKSSRRARNTAIIQAEEILHQTARDLNQHKIMF